MGWKEADNFIRLFMVPGMQHCIGGAGCDSFGQGGVAKGDPEHNLSAALERWVEKGVAPDKIIATKYKAGTKPEADVVRTRPLCRYPQVGKPYTCESCNATFDEWTWIMDWSLCEQK